jgi:hypothetical protein
MPEGDITYGPDGSVTIGATTAKGGRSTTQKEN